SWLVGSLIYQATISSFRHQRSVGALCPLVRRRLTIEEAGEGDILGIIRDGGLRQLVRAMAQSTDAERWHVVESLFEAALRRPPAERERFLREACANDPDLYREIESLLANSAADVPAHAWAAAAAVRLITQSGPLAPGRRVGPYEI